MGSIFLIRHGQASFGAADYDVLSDLGRHQARILGEHFREFGIGFDRCFSGSLKRQQDTASIAMEAAGIVSPLHVDEGFNELDAEGVLRNLLPCILPEEPAALEILRNGAVDRAAFQRVFAKLIGCWIDGRHPTGEVQSWPAFVAQVKGALARVVSSAADDERIAVFTSGGTITALLHLLTEMPAHRAFEMNWQIMNTSLTQLKFRRGEVTLASFNSSAHLQLLKAPELITYR